MPLFAARPVAILFAAGLGLAALGAAAFGASRAAAGTYEEPPFERVSSHDGWEVRNYAPVIEARVTVQGPFDVAVRSGFRVLAGYIFDKDRPEGTISMTVPVAAQPQSTTDGGPSDLRVSPSGAAGDGEAWTVAFTMPSKWTLETLPRPADDRVQLVQTAPARAAVRTFRGKMTAERSALERAALLEDLAAAGLSPAGAPVLAQFNPPWIPGMFRRNEVIVPIQLSDESAG